MAPVSVGDRVSYKDRSLKREYKIFKVLPCSCPSCQSGDTFLVNLPGILNSDDPTRHVGHEMIEKIS
jgi:hypothetical protein